MLEAALWAALGQSALIVGALLVRPALPPADRAAMARPGDGLRRRCADPRDHHGSRDRGLSRGRPGARPASGCSSARSATTSSPSGSTGTEREDPEEPVEDAAAATGLESQPAAADPRAARNLTVGMVLDGIPESVAIGLTLLGGGNVSVALVGTVFLSNLPEAIGVGRGSVGREDPGFAAVSCASAPSSPSAGSPPQWAMAC